MRTNLDSEPLCDAKMDLQLLMYMLVYKIYYTLMLVLHVNYNELTILCISVNFGPKHGVYFFNIYFQYYCETLKGITSL